VWITGPKRWIDGFANGIGAQRAIVILEPDALPSGCGARALGPAVAFSLNVSNFRATDEVARYGVAVSSRRGGAHFVIDTSRNGRGPNRDQWCNPPGRALGTLPTTTTGNRLIDAYLWIKVPGESDGTCRGGPPAGQWWPQYALGLARRSQALD